MGDAQLAIGRRIKRLRENRGLSRQQVAVHLAVDLTAVSAWESGKYLPREARRLRLASLLAIDMGTLFAEEQQPGPSEGASLVDTLSELPGLLRELLDGTKHSLKGVRLAAPKPTPPHVLAEFRDQVSRRLLDGTLDVRRIEVFYDLDRFKEVIANTVRYEGTAYRVKANCPGIKDIVPGMGAYFFDDSEVVLGGYWRQMPETLRRGLRLTGEPYRTFYQDYWNEIWARGTEINPDGRLDEKIARREALALGLEPEAWPQFLEEARNLQLTDGAPPLF
jgi:transcriptional regulator with XRE-family HTH domain